MHYPLNCTVCLKQADTNLFTDVIIVYCSICNVILRVEESVEQTISLNIIDSFLIVHKVQSQIG